MRSLSYLIKYEMLTRYTCVRVYKYETTKYSKDDFIYCFSFYIKLSRRQFVMYILNYI